jgi:hypothetical protein
MNAAALALAEVVADTKVILCGSAAGSQSLAAGLRAAGAREVLHLSLTDEQAEDVWSQTRSHERVLTDPPKRVAQALERLDADREAVVYAGSFTTCTTLCGRRVLGVRRPEWLAAEDRRQQAVLTGRPGELVAVEQLSEAVRAAPAGGVVVRGLPSDSVSLGSAHNALLGPFTPQPGLRALITRLQRDCELASVSPFVRGLPLTVYGFVAGEHVVTTAPVLGLVFASCSEGRLRAPGIVTDPPLAPAAAEVAIAGAVNAARILSDRVGYRGAFGVDGTLAGGRLLVHDLNPRICAGFRTVRPDLLGGLNASLLDLALRESTDPRPLLSWLPALLPTPTGRAVVLWDGDAQRDKALAALALPDDMETLVNDVGQIARSRGERFLAQPDAA